MGGGPGVDHPRAGVVKAAALQVEGAAGGQQPLNELAVHGKVQGFSAHAHLQDTGSKVGLLGRVSVAGGLNGALAARAPVVEVVAPG
jgi:hypothetical protein